MYRVVGKKPTAWDKRKKEFFFIGGVSKFKQSP